MRSLRLSSAALLLAACGTAAPPDGSPPDALASSDASDARAPLDARLAEASSADSAPSPDAPADASPPPDAGIVAAPEDRVLTVRNECPGLALQLGATGGYVRDCAPDGSCPAGTACLRDRMPPGCFWVLPAPERGSTDLAPGESAVFVLRTPALAHVRWSGNVYARTGCAGASCDTGACPGGSCRPGVGPVGPTTLAEFTLLDNGPDYYDVSLINGVNVPVSMAAEPSGSYAAGPAAPGSSFWCGAAGAVSPSNPALAGCPWSFAPTIGGVDRASVLRLVSPGGSACVRDSDCASGVCGTALVTGTTRTTQSCGRQLGWWTAHELCAATAGSFGAPLDCSAAAPSGTRANLFGCDGPYAQSCYSAGAASTCCGCTDGPYLATERCRASNPSWVSLVQPWVSFVKSACPTAYSYQFDDLSSTFTCQTQGALNGADYTLTFCPGGRRGF